jgi:colicin import membrane protein
VLLCKRQIFITRSKYLGLQGTNTDPQPDAQANAEQAAAQKAAAQKAAAEKAAADAMAQAEAQKAAAEKAAADAKVSFLPSLGFSAVSHTQETKKKAEEEVAAAKKLADQEAAARKKAEEEEAARKKAEALAEAARAEKAGVLCGVWGWEAHPLGVGGGRI